MELIMGGCLDIRITTLILFFLRLLRNIYTVL